MLCLAVLAIAGGGVVAIFGIVCVLCACKCTKKIAPEGAYRSHPDLTLDRHDYPLPIHSANTMPPATVMASHVLQPAAPGMVVEADGLLDVAASPKILPHASSNPAVYESCLDREFVQKEIEWAKQYGKQIIVVYEQEERRSNHFDYTAARQKYKGTSLEEILHIDAIPYQRDEDYAAAMLQKIIAKACPPPRPTESPLNEPGYWDFFLSHAQATGGDLAQTVSLRLKAANKTFWYDNAMLDKSTRAMEEGVRGCGSFVLFLTGGSDRTSSLPPTTSPPVVVAPSGAPQVRAYREQASADQLKGMTVKQLREYAATLGVSAESIENARDEHDPKAALQELIRAFGHAREEDQLQDKTVKELREHAATMGVRHDAIEEARDAVDPRASLILLIHQHRSPAMFGP